MNKNIFNNSKKTRHSLAAWMVGVTTSTLIACSSSATVTNDRDYQMGDDDGVFSVGDAVGTDFSGTLYTFDSAGSGGNGDYNDLTVEGNPVFSAGIIDALAVSFNGTDDYLHAESMNSPDTMALRLQAQSTPFPHVYSGLTRRGMQMWVMPTNLNGTKQTIISDTSEHGIFISENDTWGLKFSGNQLDSGAAVAQDEWTHVSTRTLFANRYWSALYVNGVIVQFSTARYDATIEDRMSVGAEYIDETPSEFFTGSIDDIKMHVEGDNTDAGGMDYGTYNPATDNDYIVQFLADNNITNIADVNMDGVLSGDGTGDAATDDVAAFVAGWGSSKSVSGFTNTFGDLETRQNGDLNWDGIVDADDWFILRTEYANAGLPIVTVAIPEPASIAMLLLSGAALLKRRAH